MAHSKGGGIVMIKCITVGLLQEQTYLWIDEETKHGFIIDPGAEASRLLSVIQEGGYSIEKILITHGHVDHIGAAAFLREALGAPIVIHQEGKKYLEDASWNLSIEFDRPFTFEADLYVAHGDSLALNASQNKKLQVIYAPGHSADGVAYYSQEEHIAFVGDIIFEGSIGRSDLPGGDSNRLLSSIRAEIFTLPEETILYPGHGAATTVKKEKETNPHFHFYD